MVKMILDGREIATREQLHQKLAQGLGLPGYYGANLDALFDCLTDLREEACLHILHGRELREGLGPYADVLAEVLGQAAEQNPRFTFSVEEE